MAVTSSSGDRSSSVFLVLGEEGEEEEEEEEQVANRLRQRSPRQDRCSGVAWGYHVS